VRSCGHEPSAVGTEGRCEDPGAHGPLRFLPVDVPDVSAAVLADDCQAPPVKAERERSHGSDVANHGHGAAGRDLANLDGSGRSSGRRTFAVSADRYCRHPATSPQRRKDVVRLPDAPDPYRPVRSGADDPPPILAERDGRDLAWLTSERNEIRLRAG